MLLDAIIIGAGLAGLCCARRLQRGGSRVLVLEKSRGLGGRLATRRVDNQPVDHGCKFLQSTNSLMVQLIDRLQERRILLPWQAACYNIADDGHLKAEPYSDRFVAPLGMTTVAKELAEGLDIWRQTRVTGLVWEDSSEESMESAWRLEVETPARPIQEPLRAKAVILAVPAPQALALLQSIQSQIPFALVQSLKQAVFYPTISVMAGYEMIPLPTELSEEKQGWLINGNPNTPFTWVGLDSSKRVSLAHPTIVIHSSAQFAESYLQTDDLNLAGLDLLKQTSECLHIDLTQPSWTQTHRWRYATPVEGASDGELLSETPLPLACCGDWCRGTDAGAAMESGWQAAEKIYEYFDSKPANSAVNSKLF
ncbi:MAG TPA: FAD-dependent oxidoreductase [Leptolyngbyaceae cyanobacterium]